MYSATEIISEYVLDNESQDSHHWSRELYMWKGGIDIVWWLKKGNMRDPCGKGNVQCPECINVSILVDIKL